MTGNSTEEFFQLIKSGNLDKVREQLIEDPSLVNARDQDDNSAVLIAAYYREPLIAQLLINSGAALNVFEASATGELARVMEIIQQDPGQVREFSEDGFQPLGLAAFFGHTEIVAYLLSQGADPQIASNNPMKVMPLHSAVAGQNLEIARLLLEHGAPVNVSQSEGFSPLHGAAQNGQVEMVELLIQFGAVVDARDVEGKTPLKLAEIEEHTAIVELLRSRGAAN